MAPIGTLLLSITDARSALARETGNIGLRPSCIYRYDAFGRRIKKTYAYLSQSGNVSGNIISIYGPNNALLADYRTETGP